ncbi:MAG: hypothetical protein SGARI_006434 [Bacillariaceae sp.]
MLLCNGALDAREKIVQTLKETTARRATVDMIMCMTTHGVINETAAASSADGMDDDDDDDDMFHLLHVLLWQKLAANCVCNPLTALWNVPNGELANNSIFAALREQIVNEISTVGRALHPELEKDLRPSSLDQFVEQVIHANLLNQSSMARDIAKQQRTEVENLNGYIVRKSSELGVGSAPANKELLERIQETQNSYL